MSIPPPSARRRVADGRVDVPAAPQVHLEGRRDLARLLDLGDDGRGVVRQVRDGDVGARPGQRERDGATDPRGAAGDERATAGERVLHLGALLLDCRPAPYGSDSSRSTPIVRIVRLAQRSVAPGSVLPHAPGHLEHQLDPRTSRPRRSPSWSGRASTSWPCRRPSARTSSSRARVSRRSATRWRRPGSASGTASRSSRRWASRTSRSGSRHAHVGGPGGRRGPGARRDVRRRAGVEPVRAQRPRARGPALRVQARLAGPAARRREGLARRRRRRAGGPRRRLEHRPAGHRRLGHRRSSPVART